MQLSTIDRIDVGRYKWQNLVLSTVTFSHRAGVGCWIATWETKAFAVCGLRKSIARRRVSRYLFISSKRIVANMVLIILLMLFSTFCRATSIPCWEALSRKSWIPRISGRRRTIILLNATYQLHLPDGRNSARSGITIDGGLLLSGILRYGEKRCLVTIIPLMCPTGSAKWK